MKKKHLTAMPEDLSEARQRLGRTRATIAHLLDDSDIIKKKTWKRLNEIYQSLDAADQALSVAQTALDEALPNLLKQWDKHHE